MRVAIIGYGTVSKAHMDALNSISGVVVTDIYSAHLRGDEADAVAKKHNVTVHSDLNAVLADPGIKLVSICSRPDKHADQAVAAAKAGKHIILEKPIALTRQDCLRVQVAAEQAKAMISVCFECRYSDQLLKTKVVTDSEIGEITYCEASYFHGIGPDNPQFSWNITACGGSSLLSAGCHALDAVLYIMNDSPVESVSCIASNIRHPDYERYQYPPHQFTTIKFKHGGVGYVASSIACTQPYEFPVRVMGTHGTLINNRVFKGSHCQDLPMKLLQSGDVADHPYRKQFETFIHNLATKNHEVVMAQFQAAMMTHQVVFAAELSSQLGRPVSVRKGEV